MPNYDFFRYHLYFQDFLVKTWCSKSRKNIFVISYICSIQRCMIRSNLSSATFLHFLHLTNRRQEYRERTQVRIFREPNNIGQQPFRGNKNTNRKSNRNNGIPENVWNDEKLTVQDKSRILTTCVFSILRAPETWTPKETDKKLLACQMQCYRRILRISWQDMITSEDMGKTIAREETITDTIKKRMIRQFRHIRRMNDDRLIKHTIFAKIVEKSRRDRPCRETLDDIKD